MLSKIPRTFVTASIGLLLLFVCTTYYLYNDGPAYHAPKKTPSPAKVEENWKQLDQTGGFEDGEDYDVPTTTAPVPVPSLMNDEFYTPAVPENAPGGDLGDVRGQLTASPLETDCPKEVDFLLRVGLDLGLTERVRYTRNCIKPRFSSNVDRNEVVNVTDSIFKPPVELDLLDCSELQLPRCSPIKLTVPRPYAKETFSNLIFGIATDYYRLNDSIPMFSHWLAGTEAKLIAAVTNIPDMYPEEMVFLRDKMKEAGINGHIVKPLEEGFVTSESHFGVLKDMVKYSNPDTRWFGMLDDDTFFPDLKPLSDALESLDHTTDAYVGTLSEDFSSVRNWGYMAFGGAGAYLSAPLARKLADHVFECIEEASTKEGDVIIRDCVYRRSKAKLTILPGLHQQDFQGDASGFFEAGFRPLNLHHWKSWFEAPVIAIAKAASFCGDCFLQRWRFGNDTVLSNGYSIAAYRDGHESVDLTTIEGTWDKTGEDFDFSIGPLRTPYSKEEKKTFKLLEAEITPEGNLRQLYVWKGNTSAGEIDEVVEMDWEKYGWVG
ncbi:hypothetical protein SLS62_005530 [Diatrype stigma]|uniref:Glycosyltransferase family 31 protein n=1 Tax=Diatrype stigma TaxID=117547 RepID=A0AAN9UT05_9PEZI